jgi:RNA polymerase sigma-70 factor (ECF subfamily)
MQTRASEAELSRLAGLAVDGDPDAVRLLVCGMQELVSFYVRGRLHPLGHGLIDDVVQDVCIAVLRRLSHLVAEQRALLPYIFKVAQNKIADTFRDVRRHGYLPLDDTVVELHDTGAGPEAAAVRAGLAQELRAALRRLSEREQEIIGLRVLGELPAAEVASILGMTEGNVRVTQHRALAKLRVLLGQAVSSV